MTKNAPRFVLARRRSAQPLTKLKAPRCPRPLSTLEMPVTIADMNLTAFAFAALEETFDMMENDEQHEFVKRMRDIRELKHWVREYIFSDIHNDVLQSAMMNSIVWNQLQLDFMEWAEAALDTSA